MQENDEKNIEVHLILPLSNNATNEFKISTSKDTLSSTNQGHEKRMAKRNIRDIERVTTSYFPKRDELSYCKGLISRGDRVTVPQAELVYKGHSGIIHTTSKAIHFLKLKGHHRNGGNMQNMPTYSAKTS